MNLDYKTRKGEPPNTVFHHRSEVFAIQHMLNGVLPSGETSWDEVTDDYYDSLYDSRYMNNKVDLTIANGAVVVRDL